MFTPHQPAFSMDSSNAPTSEPAKLTLRSENESIDVAHDGFSIGTSRQCDLKLTEPTIHPLHSLIRIQSGAIWIESVIEDTFLTVNDRTCRRMALRNGDRLRFGDIEFAVQIGTHSIVVPESELELEHEGEEELDEEIIGEDLTLLTAEELCDRIVAEQSLVSELSQGDQSGWEALLHAIEAAGDEPEVNQFPDEVITPAPQDLVALDTLLGEIQELNETITDRARELSEHEAEVLASTSMLEESQQKVSQRIDEILDQLTRSEPPSEFRASA